MAKIRKTSPYGKRKAKALPPIPDKIYPEYITNFIQEVFSIQEVLAFKYTKGYFVKLKTLFNAQFIKAMYVGKINLFFKQKNSFLKIL